MNKEFYTQEELPTQIYEYHVVTSNGNVFTVTSDKDLFNDGWYKLAGQYFHTWRFCSQWDIATGKHLSTVHNN